MGVRGFESDIIENWAAGVMTSPVEDQLPDGAVPYAKNTQLYNLGLGRAVFGTRTGCAVLNTETDGQEVVSQHFLDKGATTYHLYINEAGDVKVLASAGTISTIDTAVFTDTTLPFSWQTAKDLAFVVNSEQQKKTDGATIFAFGIEQPADGDWSIAEAIDGASPLPADTYQIAIQYVNSTTGHKGPISATKSITVIAGRTIVVTLPTVVAIDDAQVSHVAVYILQESTMTELLLATAGTTPAISGTNGWASGTVSVTIDTTQAELDNFITPAPNEDDNYAPPSGAKACLWFKARMYVIDDQNLYWSESGEPENFNLVSGFLPVNPDDGEANIGLAQVGDVVVVLKENNTYYLDGDTPQTYVVRKASGTYGAVSQNAMGLFDNRLFWLSNLGPIVWSGPGTPMEELARHLVDPEFDADHLDLNYSDQFVIIGHPVQNYVAWAVTEFGTSRNKIIIPYHFGVNRWMSHKWEMVDVRSCTLVPDSNGSFWPVVGDYNGNFYRVGSGYNDGVPDSITNPGGNPTSAAALSLTDTTQTWVVDELVGRYVYAYGENYDLKDAERRKIIANTADTLTIETDWTVIPSATSTYVLGGILFDFKSAERTGGQVFAKKRIEFLFLQLAAQSSGIELDAYVYKDGDNETIVKQRRIDFGTGSYFDVDDWDVARFAQVGSSRVRMPVRSTGYSWQVRLAHVGIGQRLYLYRMGMQWLTKTRKRGNSGNL